MTASSWDATSSSVSTSNFTWNTLSSALLSDGLYNYIYGNNDNIPIAQIDISDGITTDLLPDASDNVRGLVEVSSGALHPFELVGYCDYDTYGTPMTSNGGSTDPGGLDNEGEAGDPDSATHFGFGGSYADQSGFDYLVSRYYDPGVGSFLSVDPAEADTGAPFTYAADDPANQTDALGLLSYKKAKSNTSKCDSGDLSDCLGYREKHRKGKDSKLNAAFSAETQPYALKMEGSDCYMELQAEATFSSDIKGAGDSITFSSDGDLDVSDGRAHASVNAQGAIESFGADWVDGQGFALCRSRWQGLTGLCLSVKFAKISLKDGVTVNAELEAKFGIGCHDKPPAGSVSPDAAVDLELYAAVGSLVASGVTIGFGIAVSNGSEDSAGDVQGIEDLLGTLEQAPAGG